MVQSYLFDSGTNRDLTDRRTIVFEFGLHGDVVADPEHECIAPATGLTADSPVVARGRPQLPGTINTTGRPFLAACHAVAHYACTQTRTYHYAYERHVSHLSALTSRPVRILHFGLGCGAHDATVRVGAVWELWSRVFPWLHLHVMEPDVRFL
jgi:hypothetical protein